MVYEVVHECDDEETGAPTCWATRDPEGHFWWIDKTPMGYCCATKIHGHVAEVQAVRSFRMAKYWVLNNWPYYTERH